MLSSSWLSVPLGKTEVDHINVVLLLANSDEEVVRLDVSVQKVPAVNVLNSLNHLVCQHEDCLEAELSLAVVKQVFKGRTQEVDNHDVVVTLHSEPVDVGNAYSSLQNSVQLCLIQQLRMFCPNRLLRLGFGLLV